MRVETESKQGYHELRLAIKHRSHPKPSENGMQWHRNKFETGLPRKKDDPYHNPFLFERDAIVDFAYPSTLELSIDYAFYNLGELTKTAYMHIVQPSSKRFALHQFGLDNFEMPVVQKKHDKTDYRAYLNRILEVMAATPPDQSKDDSSYGSNLAILGGDYTKERNAPVDPLAFFRHIAHELGVGLKFEDAKQSWERNANIVRTYAPVALPIISHPNHRCKLYLGLSGRNYFSRDPEMVTLERMRISKELRDNPLKDFDYKNCLLKNLGERSNYLGLHVALELEHRKNGGGFVTHVIYHQDNGRVKTSQFLKQGWNKKISPYNPLEDLSKKDGHAIMQRMLEIYAGIPEHRFKQKDAFGFQTSGLDPLVEKIIRDLYSREEADRMLGTNAKPSLRTEKRYTSIPDIIPGLSLGVKSLPDMRKYLADVSFAIDSIKEAGIDAHDLEQRILQKAMSLIMQQESFQKNPIEAMALIEKLEHG